MVNLLSRLRIIYTLKAWSNLFILSDHFLVHMLTKCSADTLKS